MIHIEKTWFFYGYRLRMVYAQPRKGRVLPFFFLLLLLNNLRASPKSINAIDGKLWMFGWQKRWHLPALWRDHYLFIHFVLIRGQAVHQSTMKSTLFWWLLSGGLVGWLILWIIFKVSVVLILNLWGTFNEVWEQSSPVLALCQTQCYNHIIGSNICFILFYQYKAKNIYTLLGNWIFYLSCLLI